MNLFLVARNTHIGHKFEYCYLVDSDRNLRTFDITAVDTRTGQPNIVSATGFLACLFKAWSPISRVYLARSLKKKILHSPTPLAEAAAYFQFENFPYATDQQWRLPYQLFFILLQHADSMVNSLKNK